MYFYSPYFIVPSTSGFDDIRKEEVVHPMFYKPEEGYMRGNIFSKEYRPYKNYQPGKVVSTNEREEMLINLMMYRALCHDLTLYLDLHKEDKDALALFNRYNEEAKKALDAYVKKYGPLSPAMVDSNDYFTYVIAPMPWLL